MSLQLQSIPLAPASPYGWDFERRLEILEEHGEADGANRPGDLIPVLRFIRGHAVATSAVWLADQPFRLLERESRPNRCLVPVHAAGLTGKASDGSCGPVAMLGALARQINTTEIAGVTILSEMLDGDDTAPFVIPRPFWMKWLEPSSDVRDFIPRRRRTFPAASWSLAVPLSGAPA